MNPNSQNLEQKYRRFYPTGTKIKNYDKVIDFDCNSMLNDKAHHKGKDADSSDSKSDSDSESDHEIDKPKDKNKDNCSRQGRRKHKESVKDGSSASDRSTSEEREASVERYLEKSRERDRLKALEKDRLKAVAKCKHSKKKSPTQTNETFSIEWR